MEDLQFSPLNCIATQLGGEIIFSIYSNVFIRLFYPLYGVLSFQTTKKRQSAQVDKLTSCTLIIYRFLDMKS